jgi:hypothetical protein
MADARELCKDRRMRFSTPLLALFLFACGSTKSTFVDPPPADNGFGDGGTNIIGGGKTDGGVTGSQTGCSEAAKLVYVVSDLNELFSFKPDTGKFTKIGELKCPSSSTPNSMAVDRTGFAWVNFSDGNLFKVSTADASCAATSYVPDQEGFHTYGMAFATNGATSIEETLYVVGIEGLNAGKGLAKIDLTTMKLTTIGDFSGDLTGQGAELTGTGDGRLFGFFTTKPDAKLAQINTATGATTDESTLTGVSTGDAWAFSFWGGDFWFYTAVKPAYSVLTRKQSSTDGNISVAQQDVGGFRIVGAGVSTCAPTAPPR